MPAGWLWDWNRRRWKMVRMNIWIHMEEEMKKALGKASVVTGKNYRQIAYEALCDWLINYGFMEEED